MTGRALCFEERLPRRGVTDQDTRWLQPRLVVAGRFEGVDERRDVCNLFVGERELRHPRTATADDRRNQLSLLIRQHHGRPQQAWSAIAAAGVDAMAELAVHPVQRLAAVDRRGIAG